MFFGRFGNRRGQVQIEVTKNFPQETLQYLYIFRIPDVEDVSSLLFLLELSSYTIIGRPTSLLTESLLPG